MSKRLSLILGIVLSVLAVVLALIYFEQLKQKYESEKRALVAQAQQSQTAVLVATQNIPQGILIEAAMLKAAMIPNQYVAPQAVTSFSQVAGMATIAPIAQNEQVLLSKLVKSQQAPSTKKAISLASSTPIGYRAITIPVDNISSVGGMIKPGDYVDVLGMVPIPVETPEGKPATQQVMIPLFQNVLVLSVGEQLEDTPPKDQKKKESSPSPIITLALNPQEANLVAFVQEQGKIRLILRSPADQQTQPVQVASWETLLRYLNILPAETQATKGQKKEEEATAEVIEIYRGFNRELVPLSEVGKRVEPQSEESKKKSTKK